MRGLFSLLLGTVAALAHYTWVAPVAVPLEVGKTSTIRINHGHKFPRSEEAINATQVDLFVIEPSGARVKLKPVSSGTAVTAPYVPKAAGLHRIAFVQDRGVASRTPKGVKPGGRDINPDAIQAYRTVRTAVAYAGTSNSPAAGNKPIGLEFELTGEYSRGIWELRLTKQGKPAPGIPVEVFFAGQSKASEAGKTGSNGAITYRLPPGSKGPAMFSATVRDSATAGAKYDSINYETSLHVTW